MSRRRQITGWTCALGVVTLLAVCGAGCGSASPRTSASPKRREPTVASTAPQEPDSQAAPCTAHALMSAAARALGTGGVNGLSDFGCDGSWAYVAVTTGTGAAASQQTVVLRSSAGSWVVADTAHACAEHEVPSALAAPACASQ